VIALIDYGAGNLTSVRKALSACGAEYFTPSNPSELDGASGVVIPGVGHFGATAAIGAAWRAAVGDAVRRGVPLLGICLGMQFLFEGSEEAPGAPGLGLLEGRCVRIAGAVKVPHVGWNDLTITRPSRLLDGLPAQPQVYFTHSYAAPVTGAAAAITEYGSAFATVVERDNVFGVQFHPEKSSTAGLQILRSFVTITRFPDSQIPRFPDSQTPRC
jgi:glutamine amidotransferase